MSELRQVRLGRSGLHVSQIGLGMMSYGNGESWTLGEDEATPIVKAALDAGVTFFDTADTYGDGASEALTGRLLKKLARREELVISTKVFYPMGSGANERGLSRKHLLAAIDASLLRLGLDYVDLYQVHRFDPATPLEETMCTLHDIVRSGKALYIGASTMRAWQFAKAQRIASENGWTQFVAMQNRHNLLYREDEREMIPFCLDSGVGVLPYSPLAGGALAGTRTRAGEQLTPRSRSRPVEDPLYGRPEDFDVVELVAEIARELGTSAATLALAWLLHQPGIVAPIVGATKSVQLGDAIAATGLRLPSNVLDALAAAYTPRSWIG